VTIRRIANDVRDKARQLRGTGMPPRDIAKICKVSEAWVKKICRDITPGKPVPADPDPRRGGYAEAPPPLQRPAEPEATATASATPRTAEGALHLAYASYDNAAELAKQAQQDGNTTAAARAQALMGGALEQIRKLTKQTEGDSDVVSWPADVHRAAMQSVRERVQTLCDVPLMCTQCQRAFRVALASAGQEDTDAAGRKDKT
jgi:hypothetical protein